MVENDVHAMARHGVPLRLILYITPFPVSEFMIHHSIFDIQFFSSIEILNTPFNLFS